MEHKIKMIVSDLDGTLLNDAKKISAFTEKTLLEYQQQGCIVVLASGRFQREVDRYAKQLKLKEYNGWMVCANGYEVTRMADGSCHTFDSLNPQESQKLCSIADELKLIQYVRIADQYHLKINRLLGGGLKGAVGLLKLMHRLGYQKGTYTVHLLEETRNVQSMREYLNEDVYKICFIGTVKRIKKLIELVERVYPDQYAFYYVNPMAVEICKKSVSKRNAVEYICRQTGIQLDEVIAFGDSGNDEPLLLSAGIGVTMKNGTKKALAVARTLSAKTNNEDGVAYECLHYLGGNNENS